MFQIVIQSVLFRKGVNNTSTTTNDNDDDIQVIETSTAVKQETKTEEDIIEITESPEVVRNRKQIKCDTIESPINIPKNRVKRRLDDSDDEELSRKQIKTTTTTNDKNGSADKRIEDDIGKMAFEEMCENTIKELQSLFPEIDICEIQDALIQSDWSVFNASILLGNLYEPPERETKPIVTETKPQICTNNEKMKNLDAYRKWRPGVSNSGHNVASDDEVTAEPSHSYNSIKNNRQKFVKNYNNKKLEVLSDDSDADDDEEEFTKTSEGFVCEDSSDADSDRSDNDLQRKFKEKSSNKLYIRTQDLKNKVVDFLQTSYTFELEVVPGVSKKKIDLIVNMRPFHDWNDAIWKFRNSNLSEEILDNCAEVMRAREVVNRLMNSCEDIAKNLSDTVDRLTALDQPKVLNNEMKLSHYQMIGLNWLALMYRKGINSILADEMGLGKTIQVIAFLAYLRETKNLTGIHLVIVPASTLENWSREFQTWCPDIKLLLYYGSQEERAMIREQISRKEIDFDVILTTYTIAQSPGDRGLFKKNKFSYCVFDEAHYLKNIKSIRYESLMKIKAKHRLLLTGTPLQNNLVELMSLLIFTMPNMFNGKVDQIKKLFTYSNNDSSDRIKYINDRIEQAKKIMKPFVLRRLKSEVLKELPLKIDHVLNVPMSITQEQIYHELIENYTREIKYRKITFEDSEQNEDNNEEKYKKGNGMLMNLRKVANHPLLIRHHYNDNKLKQMSRLVIKEPKYRDSNVDYVFEDMQVMHDFELYRLCNDCESLKTFRLDHSFIEDSGKFKELDSLLTKYRLEGKRVLLFSQFVIMLDIIEEFVKLRSYRYLRLDGSTKVADRLDLIDNYNNDSDIFVFLLSTRAGGLGINLTAANVVIIHDIDFNPYNDKQAEDRCHRIGQTQEVTVYRFISQGTVEEGIHKIAEEKLKLGNDISESNQGKDDKEERIDKSDVKTLLRAALKL
ncbi:SWI/SNF-related matrix-associated actin-dependent regulator of chromatin subfamily A containing DEAD/H box 1-like [Oppia nitens]|uniref:SWI/SNF-related matrix-associated actin-dependent regulator of chromatin subfamily A containing DEAD/H box 1-like n=1 Tax=Oppia nitens TaxID=1686743 RepID=UPI0023DA27EA|nr:SWI/SNF-related matrix-associated actin-dependent regulator of chromatin subfamily A containing DEAD/H box 1-like [Oppia nitens]